MSVDKKISTLVNTQVPSFVREDHPQFVEFLEAYYEYLEQSNTAWNTANTLSQGKVVERAKNLLSYRDIDTTLDVFSERLYYEFLNFFPKNILANKKVILKNVKDFYRARGTEKSFKFIFRALFNEEAELYYPKTDILIASSGKWLIEKSIRINSVLINGISNDSLESLNLFVNTMVRGGTSNATAFIEKVSISYENNVKIIELFFSNSHGTFIDGEMISSTNKDGDTLTATMLSGQVVSLTIINRGTRYNVGDPLIFESNTGTGAAGYISSVSTGNVVNVVVISGGAGFTVNDTIQFTGGGGSGANAIVGSLDGVANSYYHPNTYNINSDMISLYANIALNSANYMFPGFPNTNANTLLANALSYFTFGPCAPLAEGSSGIIVTNGGNNYTTVPSVDIYGNTRIKELGVIGRLQIINGGLNYSVGDRLIFTNIPGGYGLGANANVVSVNANGGITRVQLQPVTDFLTGGMGYDINYLPTVSINTANGTGANIIVKTLLGYGNPKTVFSVNTGTIGVILSITLTDLGSGYRTAPTINLTSFGDGNANIIANIVSGSYTYPGRYIDDTGFLSSYNFLQDRDYYQNYSYVIKVKKSIDDYIKYIKNMLHPGGLKVFGEYILINPDNLSINLSSNDVITVASNVYNVSAVHFNNSYLAKNSALTSIANTKTGTVSLWVNPNNLSNTNQIIYFSGDSTNTNFMISIDGNNRFRITAKNTSGATVLDMYSNISGQIVTNNWIHLLSSWDLGNTSNCHLYITNVSSKNVQTYINSNIKYLNANNNIGKDMNSFFDFCSTEIWFDTNYMDLSNVQNRNKFLNNLLPKSLGISGNTPTGSSPILYLTGNTSQIITNKGTGGNFTAIGSPVDCIDSPTI